MICMIKTKAKLDVASLHHLYLHASTTKLNLISSSYYQIGKTKYVYNLTWLLQLGRGTKKKMSCQEYKVARA